MNVSTNKNLIQRYKDRYYIEPIDLADFEHVMKRVLPQGMIRYEGRTDS